MPCCSQFNKFGDTYCYHVELLSIRDLEKHYHLTAQTRTMWGIPRAASGGSGDAGGDPWSEAPDPYIPEGMSVEQVRHCVCISTVIMSLLRIAALVLLSVGVVGTLISWSVPLRRCRS